ncbi:hypothetical protein MNBD_GAMMA25-331 [hydrothermal vent metagenome]|uniref:Uncharacterized protein n=1 Tax=hydrothermal vent metagenome TaxID=652676 RepID=A0A3B1B2C9_9ZZZZ
MIKISFVILYFILSISGTSAAERADQGYRNAIVCSAFYRATSERWKGNIFSDDEYTKYLQLSEKLSDEAVRLSETNEKQTLSDLNTLTTNITNMSDHEHLKFLTSIETLCSYVSEHPVINK